MANQEEKFRLLSEHILSESFNSILQFRPLIEDAVNRESIDTPEEKSIFLALGSIFLIQSEIAMQEDSYLFCLDQNLKDEFLSCGDVPGSKVCETCTKVCPFKDEEKDKKSVVLD